MILKVCRLETVEEKDHGYSYNNIEYYSGDEIIIRNGFATIDKTKHIDLGEYTSFDVGTENAVTFTVTEVYLMNKDGKTIERIK